MRRPPGGLEDEILHILSTNEQMSVRQVREKLSSPLAHTTVMTSLVRLTNKGMLIRVRRGRSYEYALSAPAESLPALRAALRMRSELDGRAKRADVLANFVATLQPEEAAILQSLISNEDRNRP